MIVVDTNIISELMRPDPSKKVINWLDKQESTQVFLTTITIAEISYGIHVLPEGKRKTNLVNAFSMALNKAFKYRVLSFDDMAAHQYGKIMSKKRELGRPMSVLDGQISAITLAHNATLATRNIRDFEGCGVDLINPF